MGMCDCEWMRVHMICGRNLVCHYSTREPSILHFGQMIPHDVGCGGSSSNYLYVSTSQRVENVKKKKTSSG